LGQCATSRKPAGSIPDGVIGIFRPQYGPGVDSASYINEYQDYFRGVKGGRCVGLTLPPSYDMIYLTAIGFTPGGSGTEHIYTQYTEYRDGTYITLKN
jgi:hypothetical protein